MLFGSKTKAAPDESRSAPGSGRDAAVPKAAVQQPDIGKRPEGDITPNVQETRRRAMSAIRQSLTFAQIVTVLMRSPRYRHYTLGDLEWLVIPPLLAGQCRVVEYKSKQNVVSVPVAAALWASVSGEVDKK